MLSIRAVQAATAEEGTQAVVAFSLSGGCCLLDPLVILRDTYLYAFLDGSRLDNLQ